MTIDRLKPQMVRALKYDILYRLDISGKTDREKLEVIEEIRGILRHRIKEKNRRKKAGNID